MSKFVISMQAKNLEFISIRKESMDKCSVSHLLLANEKPWNCNVNFVYGAS
jgi:hypothetical protein